MINDFTNIEYLKHGNDRQKQAFFLLKELGIFEMLRKFKPIVTGTIPIAIDIPQSDLDIICECENHEVFTAEISKFYSKQNNFNVKTKYINGLLTTIAKFKTEKWDIEIFGQDCPTKDQNAYKHMITEYNILCKKGTQFKKEIIKLKQEGLKTEPAFAKLLNLEGDPYEELLRLEI